VDVPYYLSKYDPDPLRFYLTATAPETRDTEACPEGLEGSPGRTLSSATTLS
jgi:methionyl-tRNA synthetase